MRTETEIKAPRDSNLRERLSTVREREFERAMRRLEASGGFDSDERRTLEGLSHRLAARVVAEPAIATEAVDESGTDVALTLIELFESTD